MMQQEDNDSLQIVPDPDKLERYHRQQLSAMLDGELSPDQARFMLRRLQHDDGLAGRWERWQVCGDVLRGQHGALLPADFAQKVSAAIAGDAAVPEARHARKGGPRLLRWGGGAALAASVAMAALLVGRQAGIEPGQVAPQASPVFAATGTDPVPADPVAIDPAPHAPAAAAAAVAATALAAAEVPRRAAETRPSRAQAADPAGTGISSRSAAAPQLAAVAVSDPPPRPMEVAPTVASAALAGPADAPVLAGLPPAADGIGTDPFAALPMTVASRPWPRAGIGTGEGYSVGLGSMLQGAPAWPRPFESGRQPVAELFGLPPASVPRPAAATAIGTRALPARDGAREAAAAGPR
ncbi:MAG: hypothetical protein GX805_08215 [Gammaproteobacteria bacterium]|nr:hypothetical protein [Gammaproteobacteria bacterium]